MIVAFFRESAMEAMTWRGRTVEPSAAPRTIRTINGVSGRFS